MRSMALLLLAASPAFAQYGTRFDDTSGWTLTSNHAVFQWAADDTPPGHWNSAPSSLNITYAEGETVDATATSPLLDISAMAMPELSFRTKADMAEDACINDNRSLVIRDAGGGLILWYCLSKRVPSGQPYVEYTVPLNPLWGSITVSFDFFSVDGFANFGDGWFIDDFYVREATAPAPYYYCWGLSNTSSSAGAWIEAGGSSSVSADDLTLTAHGTIPNQTAIFFFGPSLLFGNLGSGTLCVGGPHRRLAVVPTGAGSPSIPVNYQSSPGNQLAPGSTWFFQCWYRDPGWAGPSNTTDAVALTFVP